MSDAHWAENPSRPHSGLGLASCAIAAFAALVMMVTLAFAGYAATNPELDSDKQITTSIGLVLMAAAGVSVPGGAIGIGGLFQSNRKPLFAIVGIVLNGMIIAGLIGLFILGVMMG